MMNNSYYMTDKKELEKLAYQYVRYIKADPSLSGYKYLICAITLTMEEPDIEYTGKYGAYAVIAEKLKAKSGGCVERGIRHLTEKLYCSLSRNEYEALFSTTKKMTNRQIINHGCNFIRYESEKLKG